MRSNQKKKTEMYTYETFKMTVRRNITRLRKDKELDVKVVAKEIGVTAKMVYDYEKGARTPSFEVLVSYAELFHTDFFKLIKKTSSLKGLGRNGFIIKNATYIDLLNKFSLLNAEKKKKAMAYIERL